MSYDYIIVGGGSAGSVMAHRLSAKSANNVLLCEAGQDTPPGNEPPEIRDSYSGLAYFDPRFHLTELNVTTQIVSHNNPDESRPPLRKYEQARVLGGGSSINGQMANRGAPTDYAEWEARGAAGWNWKDVLPYFKKVERDLDFDGPFHGNDGRIPVRRSPQQHWTGHSQAMGEACKLAGFSFLPDQNGEFVDGYFPVTHSNQDEQRVSAAMGYLDRETRKRANLTISTNTQVRELLFEGTQCVGVKALVDGREQEFRGREVILSCGAIHSPAHLLRAGIGPVGEQIASLLTFVNKTYSETGQVKLASTDPRAEPIVEFNLLSDKRDLDRLMSGFRKMAALQMSAPLKAVTDKPFPASYSDRVRK